MEDKSIFGKSQPQGISDPLRNFIEALVEEVVKEGKPFDATKKKWLRKYSENEGLDYEKLEKNLTDFFETVEELKHHESKACERLATNLGKDCYLSEETVDKLMASMNEARMVRNEATEKACVDTDETVIDEPQPKPQPKPSPRPAPQPKPSDAPKEPKGGNPKRTWLWVALAAIALAGVVIGLATRPEKGGGYEPSVEIVEDSPAEEHVDFSFSSTPLSFTANGVTFTMLPVEGGTFTMGATAEQGSDAESEEKPTHSVTLSSYYMGETEVTQALWQAVMGSNPSNFKGDNLPVEQVSWNDCQTFINKLNQLLAGQLGGKRFALPTEAQWEYAARGGKKSQGYKYSGSNTLGNVAWYTTSTTNDSGTKPVGTKQSNELGFYDMSGNVWEWCSDWYGDYGSSAQTDPTGPASGSSRVDRGGGWYYSAGYCRVSYRNYYYPDSTYSYLGLRLAL